MLRPGQNDEKVLVFNDEPNPIAAEATKLEHLTLLLGIPMIGNRLKPLLILPRLTMPDLDPKILSFYDFAGTNSGWINGEILKFWCENQLVDQIHQRRQEYQYNGRCLIILDNHSSRDSINDEYMSTTYGIDFLRLPAHSSASMQPLDRCPNGELKKLFRKNYIPVSTDDSTSRRNRILLAASISIDTALSAHYSSIGWRDAGLYPFDVERVIMKPEIIFDVPEDNNQPQHKRSRGERFSNRVLTPGLFPPVVPIPQYEI